MLGFFLMMIIGHIFAAFVIYFNHRFIMHGKLRRLPFLSTIAKIHDRHHAQAYDKEDPHIFVPLWGQILISGFIIMTAMLSIPFSIGITSFCALYMYRHWSIHNKDFCSRFHYHHSYHHIGDPRKNFSGIYPAIDKLFGTYIEPTEEFKKRSLSCRMAKLEYTKSEAQ